MSVILLEAKERKPIITRWGYRYVYCPIHPHCTSRGYVLEHRIQMENKLGRLLSPIEVVHHVDGNKLNNELDNLALFKNINEHTSYHVNDVEKPLDKYHQQIIELYKNGMGTYRIAKVINSNKRSVITLLHRFGVKMRPIKKRKEAPEVMKWCNSCGNYYPYEEFYLNQNTYDGYRNRCKDCAKREAREQKRKKSCQ